MDGDTLIILGTILPLYIGYGVLYYKVGKTEQHLKDLNGYLNNRKRR